MTRLKLYLIIGCGVVIIVAGWFLIGRIFPSNPPGPTPSERTSDSLAITKPIDQALIDSSNARIAQRQPTSDASIRAARTAQERADQAGHLADSLAADSAWKAAYQKRTEEADSLKSVSAHKDTVIIALMADTVDLRGQLGIVNKRLKTTEDVNAGLRHDLEQARQCKLLGFINCPSRIQTAAITVVSYFAGDRYQRR